jgi:hypothetical protein
VFISFITRTTRERAVTWWNPAGQTYPVLYSSFFAPVLTLIRRPCPHSATIILPVRIGYRVIALFVFRKPLFNKETLPYLRLLYEYHVIYSFRYYPRFQVITVGLGTYYPWVRGHYCILFICVNVTLWRTPVCSKTSLTFRFPNQKSVCIFLLSNSCNTFRPSHCLAFHRRRHQVPFYALQTLSAMFLSHLH